MTKIVVIGIGGVGMAHVCAAGRLGLDVVGLFDINPRILEKAKTQWRNEWQDLVEETLVQDNVMYNTDIRWVKKLDLIYDDIIIIATPPNTHKPLTEFCLENTKAKILVEKPLSDKVWVQPNVNNRLFVSTEWVYHSQLPKDIQVLEMYYPMGNTTNWSCPNLVYLDFFPHFASIIINNGYRVDSIWEIAKRETEFSFRLKCTQGQKVTDIEARGRRTVYFPGFYINKQKTEWEEDLFDKQLLAIIDGKQSRWDDLLILENRIKEK